MQETLPEHVTSPLLLRPALDDGITDPAKMREVLAPSLSAALNAATKEIKVGVWRI